MTTLASSWDFAPCWLRLERGQGLNACVSLCPECFAREVVLPDDVRAETRAWWGEIARQARRKGG